MQFGLQFVFCPQGKWLFRTAAIHIALDQPADGFQQLVSGTGAGFCVVILLDHDGGEARDAAEILADLLHQFGGMGDVRAASLGEFGVQVDRRGLDLLEGRLATGLFGRPLFLPLGLMARHADGCQAVVLVPVEMLPVMRGLRAAVRACLHAQNDSSPPSCPGGPPPSRRCACWLRCCCTPDSAGRSSPCGADRR